MIVAQQSLSSREFAALKQLGTPFSRGMIVPALKERLTTLGYAREILGNLTITTPVIPDLSNRTHDRRTIEKT